MKEKQTLIDKMRILGLVLVFLLTSCARGNPLSASATEPGTASSLVTPTDTVIPPPIQLISPSTTASPTSTATATKTPNPNPDGYELKDWREPTEIITPENINRVERIGQLVFGGNVANLAWSPEGSKLALEGSTGLSSSELFVMDSSSFTKIYQFGSIYPSPIAFSPDGKTLQIGLPYIDMTTGQIMNKDLMGVSYPGSWTDIDFSPDGKYKIIMGTDFGMIGYSNKNLPGVSFGRQYTDAMHVSISRDSKIFAVNYRFANYTELWDPYTVRPIRKLELQGITAQGIPRFSKNGTSIFFTGNGTWENKDASFLQEWDYATGKPLDVQLLPDTIMYYDLAMDLSPLSDIVIFGGFTGGIYITKTQDCDVIKVGQSSYSSAIFQTSFRPDGKMFATIELKNQGIIDLWGIPDSGGANNISTPTVAGTQTPCPKIPMIPESLIPEEGWQSAK
jgi:dipeptidyl aminopeptidase/acylaminoacyl peptidase